MLLKFSYTTTKFRLYSTTKSLPISNILNLNVQGPIKVQGWVKSLRKMKQTTFLDINDGSCTNHLQVVLNDKKPKDLSMGASISVTGVLNTTSKGQLELQAESVDVYGKCVINDGYPLASKTLTPEYLRQHLHFRPRISEFASLLRVRDCATLTIHNYLHDNGFVNVHTPLLTSNDCEGAGETFYVVPDNKHTLSKMAKENQSPEATYFNSKAFLTVSAQLQLEAVAHSLNKVYSFGPIFRAENSKSRLHLSEFYMLELEWAFIEDIQNLIDVIESLLKGVTKKILDKSHNDIEICKQGEQNFAWLDSKFITLEYDEAVEIVEKHSTNFNPKFGFTKEHELFLVNHTNGVPVFVVNWPKELKPFYMKTCSDNSKVAALDLFVPNVGELLGGSLRENNWRVLEEKLPKAALNWYLDIRKFGGVPTGGFGLGFERYLQFILGIGNIKDTIPFPRWPHNCSL